MKKRGQLNLSFGMIFSIILIIIFISFAIYGISKFLSLQKTIQIGKFSNELQNDVDKLWTGSGSESKEYSLPSDVVRVCFNEKKEGVVDLEIWSDNGIRGTYETNHLDASQLNPSCILVDGNLKIRLKKERSEALVTISKE